MVNSGLPCLAYGVAGVLLAKHVEQVVDTDSGKTVQLIFWSKEEHR